MKRLVISGLIAALAVAGCAAETDTINRVNVNVLDKSLLTGSWYYGRTVINVDYEAAGAGTYPGDSAYDFATPNALGSIPRVRWVIDEDYLYAYRDYEIYEGIDGEPAEPGEHTGHPVAAFAIEKHFNIQRSYNPNTGEEQNVLVENSTDARWYEREYMRVDWSRNLLPGYYGQITNLYEIFGLWNRESAALYVQDQTDLPDGWAPRFSFMDCNGQDDASADCQGGDADWASDYPEGQLYHFDFVTQDFLSPGMVTDPFSGRPVNWCASIYSDAPICSTIAVIVRNSFLRVSDTREYEPVNWSDSRFERHGYFRIERSTYDRSTAVDDPAYFETDFLNYGINRHNIWYQHWSRDADGAIALDDQGRRVPMPYAEREVRPIIWYTTPELPAHLVKPAMELSSEWNGVLMGTVRRLQGTPEAVYPRIECQVDDPDGYCHCTVDPTDPSVILNPTCPGRYNPFQTPEEATAAGVTNPYQCWIDVPDGSEPDWNTPGLSDSDFNAWFGAEMQGDECVNVLRVNTCNRASLAGDNASELECQQRGDSRYKFVSYVDQPGTAFLGIATMRGDPVTGETIFGDANIGGPALDGYRRFALQTYDLINGNTTDEEFVIGEDIREYLSALNRVQQPARPRIDFNVALQQNAIADPVMRQGIDSRMQAFVQRAMDLQGDEGRLAAMADRMQGLAGSPIEQRVLGSIDPSMLGGFDHTPAGSDASDLTEEALDQLSPFRSNVFEQLDREEDLARRTSRNNVYMPNEYTDWSVLEFVNRHRDWSRARVEFGVNRLLYYETQLHELGHCLGLRHMFGASADTENYFEDYYLINDAIPLPDPNAYDTDGTPGFSSVEQQNYQDAYDVAKRRREEAGIDLWTNSSVMEYTSQWYNRTVSQAGRYDVAAISFGYGDLTELYDNSAGLPYTDITPVNTPRIWAKYYVGGEVCSTDADCPFSATGSRSADLLPGNMSSGLTQTCVANPAGASGDQMCSNFDEDFEADIVGETAPNYLPVKYRFCTDDRVGTIGWCHRFDEGDSYREVVENMQEQIERQYIFTHFRRYKRTFGIGSALSRLMGRQYNILQAIFQNLLYEYISNPDYRTNEGPFGFYDQFMASVDILNLYGRILTEPDVGSYRWNDRWQRYQRASSDPDQPGAQLSVPIGLGRYVSTVYQGGLSGIERVERVGTFYDKYITLQMMAFRGYVGSYTRDLRFYTNWYDLFPVEMQQIFTGMIQDRPETYAPRVTCDGGSFPSCNDPSVVYMDYYRGDCSDPATCRPDPETQYAGMNVLEGGSRFYLRYLGTLYSLAQFPVYWDTTWANQLFICRQGQYDCHEPAEGSIEGTDYVRHTSDRFGVSFLAWQLEPEPGQPTQTSIGFSMVEEAQQASFLVRYLKTYRGDYGGAAYSAANLSAEQQTRAAEIGYTVPGNSAVDTDVDRYDDRVRDLEGFFNQIIELQRAFTSI